MREADVRAKGYPVYNVFTKDKLSNFGATGMGGTNSTGQVCFSPPLLARQRLTAPFRRRRSQISLGTADSSMATRLRTSSRALGSMDLCVSLESWKR